VPGRAIPQWRFCQHVVPLQTRAIMGWLRFWRLRSPRTIRESPEINRGIPLEHDPEKWIPVSRLREALGTIRRVA
jgi:hypothetical protein